MNNGNVNNNNKTNNNYVWPVRGGEWTPRALTYPEPEVLYRDLYASYLRCRRVKRGTMNALRFEYHAERQILGLRDVLLQGCYQPLRSIRFAVPRPKLREIIAADFRDRVVHHYLVERLERFYEPVFIDDSYACRRGKGTHAAVTRLQQFIRRGSVNGRRPLYSLHLDIKNFFMAIDRDLLCAFLDRRFEREARKFCPPDSSGALAVPAPDQVAGDRAGEIAFLRDLAQRIIRHDPLQGRIDKGSRRLLRRIPSHKTLLDSAPGQGLPIGNLTSQFLANVYLNELDQFCKHTLKCRYYLRYCDDFIILHTDREQLMQWQTEIRSYVEQRLRLQLNERYAAITPVTAGIDCLGFIVRPAYTLVRRRAINNLRQKLNQFSRELVSERSLLCGTKIMSLRCDLPRLQALRSVLASYWGHFGWADTARLRRALWRRYPWLGLVFALNGAGQLRWLANWSNDHTNLAWQCRTLAARFPEAVLFVQVGWAYLRVESGRDQRQSPQRFGQRRVLADCEQLLCEGRQVVTVKETGRRFGRLCERLPATIATTCSAVAA